jgi:hypothetical protein
LKTLYKSATKSLFGSFSELLLWIIQHKHRLHREHLWWRRGSGD